MTYPLPINDAGPSSSSTPSRPPRELLLANLSTQSNLVNQIFTIISNPPAPQPTLSSSHPVAQLYTSIGASVDELAGIVDGVWEHQSAWRNLERLKDQVRSLDRNVREVIGELEKGRIELESMVEEGRKVKESIDRAQNGKPILIHILSAGSYTG